MARNKKVPPLAILVVIGNFLLFLPCLCCSGGGLVLGPALGDGSAFAVDAKQKQQIQEQAQEMERELPNAKAIGLVINLLDFGCSLMLVVAAIGLLMKKPWGRMLCIIGAALMLVVSLGNLIYQATTTVPVQLRMQEEQMKKQAAGAAPPKGFFQGLGYGTLVVMGLITVGYPVLALGLMMTPSVRDAYSPRHRPPEDDLDDDFERRDEDDRGRDDDYDR